MPDKHIVKRIMYIFLAALAIFAMVNLFWYQFKYKPYQEKTIKMHLNEDSERPRYILNDNGYVYTVKMPGYLSFESGYLYVVSESHQDSASFVADADGNLTELNIPHVDMFIWPQLFSAAQYRVTAYEETTSSWIIINSNGDYVADDSQSEAEQAKAKKLYEKYIQEIRELLDAAVKLWGNSI